MGERQVGVALCDRGTVDGLAYWPEPSDTFWDAMATGREDELARYHTVIHLRVPDADQGYQNNPIRIESAVEAAAVDSRMRFAVLSHAGLSASVGVGIGRDLPI